MLDSKMISVILVQDMLAIMVILLLYGVAGDSMHLQGAWLLVKTVALLSPSPIWPGDQERSSINTRRFGLGPARRRLRTGPRPRQP